MTSTTLEPTLTYAQVAHELVHAPDKEKLLEASQLIQHAPFNPQPRKE